MATWSSATPICCARALICLLDCTLHRARHRGRSYATKGAFCAGQPTLHKRHRCSHGRQVAGTASSSLRHQHKACVRGCRSGLISQVEVEEPVTHLSWAHPTSGMLLADGDGAGSPTPNSQSARCPTCWHPIGGTRYSHCLWGIIFAHATTNMGAQRPLSAPATYNAVEVVHPLNAAPDILTQLVPEVDNRRADAVWVVVLAAHTRRARR
jgi:hypothetical protein